MACPTRPFPAKSSPKSSSSAGGQAPSSRRSAWCEPGHAGGGQHQAMLASAGQVHRGALGDWRSAGLGLAARARQSGGGGGGKVARSASWAPSAAPPLTCAAPPLKCAAPPLKCAAPLSRAVSLALELVPARVPFLCGHGGQPSHAAACVFQNLLPRWVPTALRSCWQAPHGLLQGAPLRGGPASPCAVSGSWGDTHSCSTGTGGIPSGGPRRTGLGPEPGGLPVWPGHLLVGRCQGWGLLQGGKPG